MFNTLKRKFDMGFQAKRSGTSPLTLDGSLGKKATNYGMDGNSEQETTTGKNKLNPSKFTSSTYISSIGSDTNIMEIVINSYYNFVKIFDNLALASGDYTIFCEILEGTYTGGNLCFYDTNNTKYSTEYNFKSGGTYKNLTFANGLNKLQIYAPSCSANCKIRLWIMSGTYYTVQTYEPYTGGIASPNPDYPQEITSVGDKTYNLFNIKDTPTTSACTKHVLNNILNITSDGTIGVYLYYDIYDISPNVQHTLSFTASGNNVGYQLRSYDANGNATVIKDATYSTNVSYTFTTPSNTAYLRLYLYGSRITGETVSYSNIQLEQGATVSAYVPYGYEIEVTQSGKNLFDINSITPNKFITHGTGEIGTSSVSNLSDYIEIKANQTYYLSYSYTSLINSDYRSLCYYNTNKTYISGIVISPVSFHTFTASQDGYIRFSYDKSYTNIQLEQCSTATTYEPYHTPVTYTAYLDEPLRKVGSVADSIDFATGKRTNNIIKYIITGSEGWSLNRTTASIIRYAFDNNLPFIVANNDSKIFAMSNYFKGVSSSDTQTMMNTISTRNTRGLHISVNINDTRLNTVAGFVNWLANTNPVAYCVLATPTTEDIDLPAIQMWSGTNIFTIGTEVQPSEISFTYQSNVL